MNFIVKYCSYVFNYIVHYSILLIVKYHYLTISEIEYLSIIKCTKQAIWIKRFVNELFNKNIKINIKIDNKPCQRYS